MDKLSLLFLCLLCACGQNKVEFRDMPNQEWQIENQVNFLYSNDQIMLAQPTLYFRHTDNYPFQNIWVKLSCEPKDSIPQFTRYEFQIATPDGRWLGKKAGAIYSRRVPLKDLTCHGDSCLIIVEQNMRKNPLPGIQSVGLEMAKN